MALALLVCLGLTGCRKKTPAVKAPDTGEVATSGQDATAEPSAAGPTIEYEEGPKPEPDTVIATAGGHRVTLADYDQSSRVSLLFSPTPITEMPPERMALPHVHLTMTRALLGNEVMLAELERRGIELSEEQLTKWLAEHDRLGKYGAALDEPEKLKSMLAPYGLTREDLMEVARAEVAKNALVEALLEDIDDEEVWKAYALNSHVRTLAVAMTTNVPSPDELDEFVAQHPDEIDAYFQKNQTKFRTPRRVRVHMVRPPAGEEADPKKLAEAAEMFGRGMQPAAIAKITGLEAETDVEMVRGENPKAFADELGSSGWMPDGPRGAYAWRVVGFEESRLPEMSRPLRREIAAEMMRREELVPHAVAALEQAKSLVKGLDPKDEEAVKAARDGVEELGAKLEVVTTRNDPGGVLPKFGLAEEVLERAFEMKVGAVSDPILSRERGFVVAVLDEQKSSREEFETNLEQNRKAYRDAYRPRALQVWIEGKLQELGATVDTRPLRVKYGVLQKK